MNDTSTPSRDEVEDLLPWYANGRLDEHDRARVEAALKTDPELARRLDLVREEMAAAIAVNEAIPAPSSRMLERLLSGMDAEPRAVAKPASSTSGLVERFAAFVQGLSPRSLAFASFAAVALIVAQGVALTGLLETQGGETYQTASAVSPAQGGGVVLIGFSPEAKIGDVAAFLKRHEASVIEGPRAGGVFKLRIGAGRPSAADVEGMAARMREERGLVVFVQPSS